MTDKRYQMDNLSPNRLSHSSPEVKDSPLERQVIYYRIHITLILLLVTAAALRLVGLGASFWYDEVNVADQAIGNYSFSERLEIIEKWRGAAPMYDLLLWQWSKLGTSEYVLRLFSVIISILGLAATFFLGAIVFDKRVSLVTVLLMIFSPSHLMYSQELRFYSLLGLLCTLSVITVLIYLKRQSWICWISLAIVHTLSLYSGYFTAFVIAIEGAYVTALLVLSILFKKPHQPVDFKVYFGLVSGLVLSVLLFFPWLIYGALNEPTGGKEFTSFGIEWVKSVSSFLAVKSSTGNILFIFLFFGGLFFSALSHRNAGSLIALLVLMLPPIGLWLVNRSGYFYADRQNFIVIPFYTLFVAAGIVGLSEFVSRLVSNRVHQKWIIISSVFLINILIITFQFPEAKNYLSHQLLWRQEWKSVAQDLKNHADQTDLVTHVWPNKRVAYLWDRCLDFYFPDDLQISTKKLTDAAWELKKLDLEQKQAALPRTIWYISAKSKEIDYDKYEVGKFGSLNLFRPKKNPANIDEMIELLGSYPLEAGVDSLEEAGASIEVFAIFGRYERAFEIAASHNNNAVLYCLLGSVALKNKNQEIAKRAYEAAFIIHPDLACIPLSEIYIKEKNGEEALRVLIKGASTNRDLYTMVRLGMIYQYQKQYDAAEATYIEIIRESPGYSLAHYRLAQLYCGQKQYKKALEEFFLTIKLEPGKTVSVYEQCETMAERILEQGDKELALHVYRSILEHDPTHIGVRKKIDQLTSMPKN